MRVHSHCQPEKRARLAAARSGRQQEHSSGQLLARPVRVQLLVERSGAAGGALAGDQLQRQEQEQYEQQRQINQNQQELERQRREAERLRRDEYNRY